MWIQSRVAAIAERQALPAAPEYHAAWFLPAALPLMVSQVCSALIQTVNMCGIASQSAMLR